MHADARMCLAQQEYDSSLEIKYAGVTDMCKPDAAGRRDSFGRRIEVFQNQVHSNPMSACNLLPDVLPLVPGQLPVAAALSMPAELLPIQAALNLGKSFFTGRCPDLCC